MVFVICLEMHGLVFHVAETEYSVTIGLDLGDKYTNFCALNTLAGELLEQTRIPTTTIAFQKRFADMPSASVALETGTHSS